MTGRSVPDQDTAACSSDWLEPFEGSGIEWHESLPSPYTYQASDFQKLLAAVHEYEAALMKMRQERDLVYGELNRALGEHAPKAWDRIKERIA